MPTDKKSVTIRTSGAEKRHGIVVLTVAAYGFILTPMIFFRGKPNLNNKDIVAPEYFVIITQEKVWMYESLMFTSFEKVWQRGSFKLPHHRDKILLTGLMKAFIT